MRGRHRRLSKRTFTQDDQGEEIEAFAHVCADKCQNLTHLRPTEMKRHLSYAHNVPHYVNPTVLALGIAKGYSAVDGGGDKVRGCRQEHVPTAHGIFANLPGDQTVLKGQGEARKHEKEGHGPEDGLDLVVWVERGANLGKAHHDAEVDGFATSL